jgi:glyoxylase-like metal-dependent hydrolase (beta-lactamase superfamily II)
MKTPDITFNDVLKLNLGDLTLEMVYYGYSHTNTHIIIYIPEERILFTGGIINKDLIPISEIDESAPPDLAENWLEILSRFTDDTLDLKYLIPSHGGKEAMYGVELLSRYAEYIDTLWKQVSQMKLENMSLKTIKDRLNFEIHFEDYHDLDNSVGVGTNWGIENIHEQNIDGFWLLSQ